MHSALWVHRAAGDAGWVCGNTAITVKFHRVYRGYGSLHLRLTGDVMPDECDVHVGFREDLVASDLAVSVFCTPINIFFSFCRL